MLVFLALAAITNQVCAVIRPHCAKCCLFFSSFLLVPPHPQLSALLALGTATLYLREASQCQVDRASSSGMNNADPDRSANSPSSDPRKDFGSHQPTRIGSFLMINSMPRLHCALRHNYSITGMRIEEKIFFPFSQSCIPKLTD